MNDKPLNRIPVVYLCGGINGLSDADAKNWRELAKLSLPQTLDPMRRDYRGKEADNVREIVRGDLCDVANCDVVLAMCPRPSWGTAMEIYFAHSIGIRVFSVIPSGPVSPWLAYHSKTCPTLASAIGEIRSLFPW
jgi:hypothetical protein